MFCCNNKVSAVTLHVEDSSPIQNRDERKMVYRNEKFVPESKFFVKLFQKFCFCDHGWSNEDTISNFEIELTNQYGYSAVKGAERFTKINLITKQQNNEPLLYWEWEALHEKANWCKEIEETITLFHSQLTNKYRPILV